MAPSCVSQGRSGQAAVGPVSLPVADFALAPVRLPGRSSHASLSAAAGEVDREVPAISLREVHRREVRSQTGPEDGASGPIHVIPLPAASLLPSCCSPFWRLPGLPPRRELPQTCRWHPHHSLSPDQRKEDQREVCVVLWKPNLREQRG